jgi:phenylalanyl-tRNA synthetase alpha chain
MLEIVEEILKIKKEFAKESEIISDIKEFEQLRIKYLGRKGIISSYFKQLSKLPNENIPFVGKELNSLKNYIDSKLSEIQKKFTVIQKTEEKLDISLPGFKRFLGKKHPITKIMEEIQSIFSSMGFDIAEGPDIETDYYNFEALNIPPEHPAREEHDTFFLMNDMLLRTHTSPVQIRVMEKKRPPIRIIAPGRVFRRDTPDATHSPIFTQVEGLYVDKSVTFGELKGVILSFARAMFGKDMRIRFRPSYFQFTEPSAEYDFLCIFCKGKGCKICKWVGWVEISGAGMVDPEVFKFVNIDPEMYSGFAFGMGVERIAMFRYQINDIRLFYENDIRFLDQF